MATSLLLLSSVARSNDSDSNYLDAKSYDAFRVLAYFQVVFEVFIFGGWLMVSGTVLCLASISEYAEKLHKRAESADPTTQQTIHEKIHLLKNIQKEPKLVQLRELAWHLVFLKEFYVNAFSAIAAPLGLLLNPIFFGVQIFRVIKYNISLQNVVKALTMKAGELMQASLLGTLICYLFAMIAFSFYPDDLDAEEGNGFNCFTLSRCFTLVVIYGLKADGGMGGEMEHPTWWISNYYWRVIWDFSFWAILCIIFLNVIFGIILDTFAELRDLRQERLRDMHTTCFICGLESHQFSRRAEGFQHHYKEEHNQWNYFRYFLYLSLRSEGSYTGQESYVAKRYHHRDLSFFPAERAISIETTSNLLTKIREERVTQLAETSLMRYQQFGATMIVSEVRHTAELEVEEVRRRPSLNTSGIMGDNTFDTEDDTAEESERLALWNNDGALHNDDSSAWQTDTSADPYEDELGKEFLTPVVREEMILEAQRLIKSNTERIVALVKILSQ